jgi:hypothetical protein
MDGEEYASRLMWTTAALVIVGAVAMIFGWILAPKNVNYYYLSHGGGGVQNANCVFAHWTWHPDEVAFCTDDYQRALDFAARANAGLLKPENK